MEDEKYEWIPVVIKPNDQSLVGETVRACEWINQQAQCEIKHVGEEIIVVKQNYREKVFDITYNWLIRREKKKVKKVCTWEEDEDGSWNTSCDNKFVLEEGTPLDNDMEFCCYCGTKLSEKPNKPDGTFTEPDDG